jgi:hypothetical protein
MIKRYTKKLVKYFVEFSQENEEQTETNDHWNATLTDLRMTQGLLSMTQELLYKLGKYNELFKLNTYTNMLDFMVAMTKVEIAYRDRQGHAKSNSAEMQALIYKNTQNIREQLCYAIDLPKDNEFYKLIHLGTLRKLVKENG